MNDAITNHSLTVPDDAKGERLDRFLAAGLAVLSRARIQTMIKAGVVVKSDGVAVTDPAHKVRSGETFRIDIPEPAAAEPAGEIIPLTIVYEDADLIIVDKPAGLVVHPAAGHATGTLVNALIAHCGDTLSGIGGVKRPGIVHRLDKDTTGLLVVAKNDRAHQFLSDQFAAHGIDGRLERRYAALVWGCPLHRKGTINAALARSTTDRKKFSVSRARHARHAISHFEVVERYGPDAAKPLASLVHVTLETGRTHQIRVHMAHLGHPVIGDPVYGKGFAASSRKLTVAARAAVDGLERQALHAAILGFVHPRTGKPKRFESPLPADIVAVRAALGPRHK